MTYSLAYLLIYSLSFFVSPLVNYLLKSFAVFFNLDCLVIVKFEEFFV